MKKYILMMAGVVSFTLHGAAFGEAAGGGCLSFFMNNSPEIDSEFKEALITIYQKHIDSSLALYEYEIYRNRQDKNSATFIESTVESSKNPSLDTINTLLKHFTSYKEQELNNYRSFINQFIALYSDVIEEAYTIYKSHEAYNKEDNLDNRAFTTLYMDLISEYLESRFPVFNIKDYTLLVKNFIDQNSKNTTQEVITQKVNEFTQKTNKILSALFVQVFNEKVPKLLWKAQPLDYRSSDIGKIMEAYKLLPIIHWEPPLLDESKLVFKTGAVMINDLLHMKDLYVHDIKTALNNYEQKKIAEQQQAEENTESTARTYTVKSYTENISPRQFLTQQLMNSYQKNKPKSSEKNTDMDQNFISFIKQFVEDAKLVLQDTKIVQTNRGEVLLDDTWQEFYPKYRTKEKEIFTQLVGNWDEPE